MRRLANRINACSDLLGKEIAKAPSQIRNNDAGVTGNQDGDAKQNLKRDYLEALAFSNQFEVIKTETDVKKKNILKAGCQLWFKTAPLHYTTKSICDW